MTEMSMRERAARNLARQHYGRYQNADDVYVNNRVQIDWAKGNTADWYAKVDVVLDALAAPTTDALAVGDQAMREQMATIGGKVDTVTTMATFRAVIQAIKEGK